MDAPRETGQSLVPSPAQQSWGAFISIVIIVLMVVFGAYYAWERRLAENRQYAMPQYEVPATATDATTTNP